MECDGLVFCWLPLGTVFVNDDLILSCVNGAVDGRLLLSTTWISITGALCFNCTILAAMKLYFKLTLYIETILTNSFNKTTYTDFKMNLPQNGQSSIRNIKNTINELKLYLYFSENIRCYHHKNLSKKSYFFRYKFSQVI